MEKGSKVEIQTRRSNRLEQGKLKAKRTSSTLVYLLSVLYTSSLLFLHGHSEYSIPQEHTAPDLLLCHRPLLVFRVCCSAPSTFCPPPADLDALRPASLPLLTLLSQLLQHGAFPFLCSALSVGTQPCTQLRSGSSESLGSSGSHSALSWAVLGSAHSPPLQSFH